VNPTAEPNSPTRMIGLRPTRSEARPQTGAKTNCIAENEAIRKPTLEALAPKLST